MNLIVTSFSTKYVGGTFKLEFFLRKTVSQKRFKSRKLMLKTCVAKNLKFVKLVFDYDLDDRFYSLFHQFRLMLASRLVLVDFDHFWREFQILR